MHEGKILLHLFCLVIFFHLFYRFWLFIKGLTLQWDSGLVQRLFQNVVTRASATETDVSSKSDFYVFIWKRQSNLSKAINKMSPWIILHLVIRYVIIECPGKHNQLTILLIRLSVCFSSDQIFFVGFLNSKTYCFKFRAMYFMLPKCKGVFMYPEKWCDCLIDIDIYCWSKFWLLNILSKTYILLLTPRSVTGYFYSILKIFIKIKNIQIKRQ